jgi:hypothetical protein
LYNQPQGDGDQSQAADHSDKESSRSGENVANALSLISLVDHRNSQANGQNQPKPIGSHGQGLANKAGKKERHSFDLYMANRVCVLATSK